MTDKEPTYHAAAMSMSHGLYWQARAAALRADQEGISGSVYCEEPQDGRRKNYAFAAPSAVILAVAAAEAGINEMIIAPFFYAPKLTLPEGFTELPLRTKWLLLPHLVKAKTFDQGNAPWQDFNALVALRDRIVHFKWQSQPPKVMRHLEARDLALRNKGDVKWDWMTAASTNFVAHWAADTVSLMFSELTRFFDRENSEVWSWGARAFPVK